MIIKKIMDGDLASCENMIRLDEKLNKLDDEFMDLIRKFPEEDQVRAEDLFGSYMERTVRISYLQGLKDMYELQEVLKKSTIEILQEQIDR